MGLDIAQLEASFISKYWLAKYYTQDECPSSLIAALEKELPHIERGEWPSRLSWGGVYLNGLAQFSDLQLLAPCKVEYYEPKFKIDQAANFFPEFKKEYILHEDQDLLICYKPAGLPCHPAKEQIHFNLRSYIERHLGQKVHMPSRLDMSTQGLVLISKSERMHGKCQKLFSERRIHKTYLLNVAKNLPWQTTKVDAAIGHDHRHAVLRKVVSEGGQQAQTDFKVIGSNSSGPILMAHPITGRTHQIRVHIAHLGAPIIGDKFYCGTEDPELRLVSYSLSFLHPYLGRTLEVKLPRELLPDWLLNADTKLDS